MKTKKRLTTTPTSKIKQLTTAVMSGKLDKRKRWLIAGILLYVISPIDLIPDFLPIAGYADDVVLPILLLVAEHMMTQHTEDKRKDVSPQD